LEKSINYLFNTNKVLLKHIVFILKYESKNHTKVGGSST